MAEDETNGWTEYRRLVLKELERLHVDVSDMNDQIGKLRTQVAMLNVKAGAWGFASGLIPAIGVLLWSLIK